MCSYIQSCYKDECRFFAGLLFVYRIIVSAVFAFTPTTALNFAWLLGFLLFVLLLHSTYQPYKKRWHNFIEGLIFTILASIVTINFYCLYQADATKLTNTPTNASFWIQIVLLYLPLVYFIVYTSIKVFLWLRPRIALVTDAILKLCGKNNTYPWDVANLCNSCDFPAHMEDDDDDNYSTTYTSESVSDHESLVPEDEQHHQQQARGNNDDDDDDDDVEMIHPVECK